jgi:hypothetical protein
MFILFSKDFILITTYIRKRSIFQKRLVFSKIMNVLGYNVDRSVFVNRRL